MTIPQEWLSASLDDLKVIERIIDMEGLSHIVAFHAQQSIEKSFKALLELQSKKIPRQHDLLKLKSLIDLDIAIDDDLLDTLNQLYIDSRYPGNFGLLPHGKPSLDDANSFYATAKTLFNEVNRQIND